MGILAPGGAYGVDTPELHVLLSGTVVMEDCRLLWEVTMAGWAPGKLILGAGGRLLPNRGLLAQPSKVQAAEVGMPVPMPPPVVMGAA